MISANSPDYNELISSFTSDCSVDFRKEYQFCWIGNEFVMSDKVLTRLILWHRRLCNPRVERLKWTIKNIVGIDLDMSDIESLPYEACDMGNSLKFTTNERKTRMKNVGEGWHCDVGTLNPVSIQRHAYFCLTTDDVSRFRIFCALNRKSEAAEELNSILARANSELKSKHNPRVKRVTINSGRDWGLTSFQEFSKEQAIEIVVSAPSKQYQNGVSKRGIPFVQDAARCCTIQMKVPSVFWNYMLEMVCYTLNCTS